MATASQGAIAGPWHRIAGRNGLLDKYFYFAMSLLIAGIVVWGFSHTVNDSLFHPAIPRPLLLWIHGSAFSAWVAFYIAQSALVRTRNVKWHRFFGWFGAALGTSMVPLGVVTAIVMTRFDMSTLHQTGVESFLIVPFFDMAAFAVFFGLAIFWRRKPELHRRLIFIATCGLLSAAFGRVDYLSSHSLFYAGVDLVIVLGVVRDLLVNRRVHRVYLIAVPALVLGHIFVIHTVNSGSGWWLRIAHGIIG
jgi:hypothetical protein